MADITMATDQPDFVRRSEPAVRALGMDYLLFGVQVNRWQMDPLQHVVSTYPIEYDQEYRDEGFIRFDPTVPHCLTSDDPMVWDPKDYTTPGSQRVLEESRKHGLGYGVSLAVRRGRHSQLMLSVARDKPIRDPRELEILIAGSRVLATVGLHVIENKILPPLEIAARPRLSPQELECLKWLAQGKSNSVIGDILNISEATVEFHLKNLFKKMNVTTRLQAAIKGLELKLVT